MLRINHNDAVQLEEIVRGLYGCDRAGISGLADADNFERNPFQAAVLVVAFIHSRGMGVKADQYASFLTKYENIFVNNNDDNDNDKTVKEFVKELRKIKNSVVEAYRIQ